MRAPEKAITRAIGRAVCNDHFVTRKQLISLKALVTLKEQYIPGCCEIFLGINCQGTRIRNLILFFVLRFRQRKVNRNLDDGGLVCFAYGQRFWIDSFGRDIWYLRVYLKVW